MQVEEDPLGANNGWLPTQCNGVLRQMGSNRILPMWDASSRDEKQSLSRPYGQPGRFNKRLGWLKI